MSGPRATVDDLGASWFGAGLSPHALTRLRESASSRIYESGEAVMREGDLAPPFGIVSAAEIDLRDILRASLAAMRVAIEALDPRPEAVLLDDALAARRPAGGEMLLSLTFALGITLARAAHRGRRDR